MEAEKAVAVFQIDLGRVEVEQSLAEGCRLRLHQGGLAGGDKHAIAVAPLEPVFDGATGPGRKPRPHPYASLQLPVRVSDRELK